MINRASTPNEGEKMLTFNLKKEWFEKIKSGEKTHEYREMTPYWEKRIYNAISKAKTFHLPCHLTACTSFLFCTKLF